MKGTKAAIITSIISAKPPGRVTRYISERIRREFAAGISCRTYLFMIKINSVHDKINSVHDKD